MGEMVNPLALGARDRWFESSHLDKYKKSNNMLKVIIKYPNGDQRVRQIPDEILGVSERGDVVRSAYIDKVDSFDNVVIHSEDDEFYDPYVGESIRDEDLKKNYSPYDGLIEITLFNNK